MCIKPLNLPDRTVKCGQCKECLTQRARTWALRLTEENRRQKSAYFCTLTYSEENVPIIDTIHEGKEITVTTLVQKDMQDFLKRIRNNQRKITTKKIRMFYTGEYGGDTKRAHYHMIIFNLDKNLTSFDPTRKSKKPQVDHKLERIWKKGHVRTGRVEGGSIRYVTNYMMSKNIDVIGEQKKPFLACSQGLGAGYLDDYQMRHWEQGEHKVVTSKPMKYRPNLPRYYMERLFDEGQRQVINQFKREEMEEYITELEQNAENKDPLDPKGYITRQKLSKQEAKERYIKFLNKSKL